MEKEVRRSPRNKSKNKEPSLTIEPSPKSTSRQRSRGKTPAPKDHGRSTKRGQKVFICHQQLLQYLWATNLSLIC